MLPKGSLLLSVFILLQDLLPCPVLLFCSNVSSILNMNECACVCARACAHVCMCMCVSHGPHRSVFVGRGVVRSGNLQLPALVPELSVTARRRPISALDLIVFSPRGGPCCQPHFL